MTRQELVELFRHRGLAPWQAEFAAAFLDADSPPFHLLEGLPGTGRGYTAAAIVLEMARQGATRILVLAPSALATLWAERLHAARSPLPVYHMTRRLYREMEAEQPAYQSPWSVGGIFVVSDDMAKRSDFASGILAVDWDLVTVDEYHRFLGGQRAALLEAMKDRHVVRRLLLLKTPLQDIAMDLRPNEPTTHPQVHELLQRPPVVTTWNLNPAPRIWGVVTYRRGQDELEFLESFLHRSSSLAKAASLEQATLTRLSRLASSSLFTLEEGLRRLRRRLRAGVTSPTPNDQVDASGTSDGQDETETEKDQIDGSGRAYTLEIIDDWLQSLDTVATDEKLDAYRDLIQNDVSGVPGSGPRSVCVCASYDDTLSYLQAATGDIEDRLFRLTASLPLEERTNSIESFERDGGILFVSDAAMQGFELLKVALVIHYDLPASLNLFEQRIGRFNPFGRLNEVRMVLFRDESAAIPFEGRELGELLRRETTGPIVPRPPNG